MPRLGGLAALLLLVAGAVLAVDGALRGDLRHRLLAVALGACLVLLGLFVHLARARDGRRSLRRLRTTLLATGLSLLAAEVVLRGVGMGPLPSWTFVPSEELGHKAPRHAGVDERGFFNPVALERAELVFIGDSQTAGLFGPGERYSDQVAELTGLSAYNMAHGGYGPGQYAVLAKASTELRPERVVIGFYFGNDLLDAYYYAGLPGREELRAPGMRYPRYPHLVDRRGTPANLGMTLIDLCVDGTSVGSRSAQVVRDWMKSRYPVSYAEPDGPRVRSGPLATRMTPRYRLGPMDVERPRTRDGLRITRQAFARIRAACDLAGSEPLLLFLPTKEFCYARLAERGVVEVEGLAGLLDLELAEHTARTEVRRIAEEARLPVLDPTEDLLEAMVRGENPWSPTSDGHFDQTGHRLIARFLADSLAADEPR